MTKDTITNAELISPSEALNKFVPIEQIGVAWVEEESEDVQCGFNIGDIGFLVDPELGSEVIHEYEICNIPNTPLWFSGMVNIRGNLIPVFDLKYLFVEEITELKQQHLLIIGKGDKAAGILLDNLPKVLRGVKDLSDIPSVPSVLSEHVKVAYKQGDNIWIEYDLEGFLMQLGKQINS